MKWIKRFAVILVLSVIFHLIFITVFPGAMMYAVLQIIRGDRAVNTLYHGEPETAGRDPVPMTSPNLLKSTCIFDVSEKPLRITASVPDIYWSISFYASNTDNFFVRNDEQVPSKEVKLLLVNREYIHTGDEEVVVSPTDTGFMIIRMLITHPEGLEELKEIQEKAVVEQLAGY
jgi:uncharacterized membrane protein